MGLVIEYEYASYVASLYTGLGRIRLSMPVSFPIAEKQESHTVRKKWSWGWLRVSINLIAGTTHPKSILTGV